jgi:hypothetical protein
MIKKYYVENNPIIPSPLAGRRSRSREEGGDIVKSSMKNRSVTYRKTMKTLPLVEDPAELWRGRGRKTQPYSPPP